MAGFLGMIVFSSQRKIGSNAIANKKPLAGQPFFDAPDHGKLSPGFPCKFYVVNTVAVDLSHEPTNELWWLRLLKDV